MRHRGLEEIHASEGPSNVTFINFTVYLSLLGEAEGPGGDLNSNPNCVT